MPMEPTPWAQVVEAVAVKFTGEPTAALLAGEVIETPDRPVIVIVIPAVEAPPQLSQASTTVL